MLRVHLVAGCLDVNIYKQFRSYRQVFFPVESLGTQKYLPIYPTSLTVYLPITYPLNMCMHFMPLGGGGGGGTVWKLWALEAEISIPPFGPLVHYPRVKRLLVDGQTTWLILAESLEFVLYALNTRYGEWITTLELYGPSRDPYCRDHSISPVVAKWKFQWGHKEFSSIMLLFILNTTRTTLKIPPLSDSLVLYHHWCAFTWMFTSDYTSNLFVFITIVIIARFLFFNNTVLKLHIIRMQL